MSIVRFYWFGSVFPCIVGARMAGDIRAESEGKVDLTGWYLELVPDDLHHSYRQHLSAKRQGNIDLTEQDYLNIPDYIDGYDDILAVNTFKQGDREVVLGKKINGYSVIMALISNKRKSLHFKNMWGLDTPTYEKRYGKRGRSTASHPGRSSVSANDPPKMIHGASSGLSISQPVQVVNPRLALPGGIPADIPPGLRKLYSLAQEMSTKPQPREIPQRPVQQSPQGILAQLAQGMARDSLQGGALADRSDADIIDMLDKISPTGEGLQSTPFEDIMSQKEADSDGREERAESSQDFRQRSLSEGLTVFEGDAATYGYRRASDTNQRARLIREELKELGIPADIADGAVWRNKDSITKRLEISEAATVGGKVVLISGNVSLPPRCVAGHEGFHYWKGTPARQKYIETLRDNLNFSSVEFLQYQSKIAKAYLGEEIDLTDSKQVRALEEELFAYISGHIHEGCHDPALRPMFRDFDAVKQAWEQLVKLNAAPGKTLKIPGQDAEGGQDILLQLARGMTQGPTSPLADLPDEDLNHILSEIASRQDTTSDSGPDKDPVSFLETTLDVNHALVKGIIPKGVEIRRLRTIAGNPSGTVLRVAAELSKKYGGQPLQWIKIGGIIRTDNFRYDVHWFELDGKHYEEKVKHINEVKRK